MTDRELLAYISGILENPNNYLGKNPTYNPETIDEIIEEINARFVK